jgi:hypothetical protein
MPLAIDTLPLEKRPKAAAGPSKSAARAPSASPVSAPITPAAAPVTPAAAMGDVFIAMPGGSGQVFEQGQLLGAAPGRLRLSAGVHNLTVRAASGATHAVWVDIKPGAPTLVTVSSGQ